MNGNQPMNQEPDEWSNAPIYNIITIVKNNVASVLKQKRFTLLMLAVLIPGIFISLIAILSVSQQKQSKVISLQEKLLEELTLSRDQIENQIHQEIKKILDAAQKPINYEKPEQILDVLKNLLISYPMVQYPFLINTQNTFIYPFSKPSPDVLIKSADYQLQSAKIAGQYQQGKHLEFVERNFTAAIKKYVKALRLSHSVSDNHHLFLAIARCYFKLHKFPQTLSYLKDLDATLQPEFEKKPAFLCQFLRLYALALIEANQQKEALKKYLYLYEKILDYETSTNLDTLSYYKNEALNYLNNQIRESDNENTRFIQAKIQDRLAHASKLDISLKWYYFEVENSSEELTSGKKNQDISRFQKIKELVIPTDAKNQFYAGIKNIIDWQGLDSGPHHFCKQIQPLQSKTPATIAFRKIYLDHPKYKDIFFGFKISFIYIQTQLIPQIIPSRFTSQDISLRIEGQGTKIPIQAKQSPPTSTILSIPFKSILAGYVLKLQSFRKNYVDSKVKQDIFLNYALILAFIFSLIAGIILFYKYLLREVELVKIKSNFVDSASHTIKTPLTRIRMMAEKFQLGWIADESKKEEYLQTIISETDRMTEMINNMLDFSKIEAGKKEYDFKEESIQEILKPLFRQYSQYMEKLGFQFDIHISPQVPVFSFDTEALKLMMTNMIQNAIKYSGEKKHISINIFKQHDQVVIRIEDRGLGIKEEDQSNIFKKFFRVEDEQSKALEGSGLGLFLVQHAVQAHQGSIEVKSQPGKGSTFFICLPLHRNAKTRYNNRDQAKTPKDGRNMKGKE